MNSLFFDLQVNGYAGVDFNQNDLSAEDLHKACTKLKEDGVKGILATIITADINDMMARLNRLAKIREQDDLVQEIIWGMHIEGPFLSNKPGYIGAHSLEWIRSGDVDIMKRLLNAAEGLTRVATLDPENDAGFKIIKMLVKQDIVVSAGHCNPSLDLLIEAVDAGLTMFTHLGNACPQDLPRHDNIIQRALTLRNKLWLCFIADGIHIPFYVLKNYIDLVGYEKTIIVTDAMAATSAVPGKYTLGNLQLEVGDDKIVREVGKNYYAGAAIDMKRSYDNLIVEIGLSEEQARRLTAVNPIQACISNEKSLP